MNSPGAYTAYGKKRCAETEGQDESVQLQSTLPSVRIRQEGNVVEGSLAVTYFRTRDVHYHWRNFVSWSCSGWEGVGPKRYGRQA